MNQPQIRPSMDRMTLTGETSAAPTEGIFSIARNLITGRGKYLKGEQKSSPFLFYHYVVFFSMALFFSAIFYAVDTPNRGVKYIDSLFLVCAAISGAGLITINLSSLNTVQQLLLCYLMSISSPVFISQIPVWIRIVAFHRQFEAHKLQAGPATPGSSDGVTLVNTESPRPTLHNDNSQDNEDATEMAPLPPTQQAFMSDVSSNSEFPHSCMEDIPLSNNNIPRNNSLEIITNEVVLRAPLTTTTTTVTDVPTPASALIHHLVLDKLPREYRALRFLGFLIPLYLLFFQVLGVVALGTYMVLNKQELARKFGVHPWWCGMFTAISAFNNDGLSLLDTSAIDLADSKFSLLAISLLTFAGNTAFPIFLRFSLWIMLKFLQFTKSRNNILSKRMTRQRIEEIKYILKYPRRVYTHLFPSNSTLLLLFTLILLNGIDWGSFQRANRKNYLNLPVESSLVDGFFQTSQVRSAGMTVVVISSLELGLQVTYAVMMYIAVFPVTIAMRGSATYHEKTLDKSTTDDDEAGRVQRYPGLFRVACSKIWGGTFLTMDQFQQHFQKDLPTLAISIIGLAYFEADNFANNPRDFALWNIIFEVISAYGCVGLSTGLHDQHYSLSGGFSWRSKFVICWVMMKGRHRGLPVEIDEAIQLHDPHMDDPDSDEEEEEEEEEEIGES